jgi:hypothetical protein
MSKKIKEETQIEETKEVEITDTPAKAAYRVFLEKYKKKNPDKYEQKKAEFDRQLRGDIEVKENPSSKTITFTFSNTPKK